MTWRRRRWGGDGCDGGGNGGVVVMAVVTAKQITMHIINKISYQALVTHRNGTHAKPASICNPAKTELSPVSERDRGEDGNREEIHSAFSESKVTRWG